jgi:orotidine-5'-phosphate decarboxylase
VTVLTSKTEEVVEEEFGGRTSVDQVLFYVSLLKDAGFTDVVCSPREVAAIRSDNYFDNLELNTPGIVMPGGDAQDQARTDTPGGAVRAGSTRLVIGRALTGNDCAANSAAIVNDIGLAAV